MDSQIDRLHQLLGELREIEASEGPHADDTYIVERLRVWKRAAVDTVRRIFGDEDANILDRLRENILGRRKPERDIQAYWGFITAKIDQLARLPEEVTPPPSRSQESLHAADRHEDDTAPGQPGQSNIGLEPTEPTVVGEAGSRVDPHSVFVVYGRNDGIRSAMFSFLRAIGLDPIEWTQAIEMTGHATPYAGEIVDSGMDAQAIVVIMTPDDEAKLSDHLQGDNEPDYERNLTGQPRQNVLFEAGLALGRSPNRTILVEIGSLRPMSDIGGRFTVRLDNTAQMRQALVQRLKDAQCAVNISGTDWLSEGDFQVAATPSALIEEHPLGEQEAQRIMARVLQDERNNRGKFVAVHSWAATFNHLKDADSYFTLDLDIVNCSVGAITIGREIVGHIQYHTGNILPIEPQVPNLLSLRRAGTGKVELRQYVSNDIAGDFQAHAASTISIQCGSVSVSVDFEYPDGSHETGSLVLPSPLNLKIPSVAELKS